MMRPYAATRCLWHLIHKDLTREFRAQQAWPRTLLLGLVLVLLVSAQIDLPMDQKADIVCGLLWIAIFFSATVLIERSIESEHGDGCWQALARYPVSPGLIYFAKTAVNAATIVILASVLIPLFIVFTDVPLWVRPGVMALTVVLGSIGLAAVGTLISAVTASVGDGGGVLVLLLLPLASPILLASSESTRIALTADTDPLRWWIHLLAAFAVIFMVLGPLVFDVAMED